MLHITRKQNSGYNPRISDVGMREILGVNGSARGFIETGNAKHPMYYRKQKAYSPAQVRKEKDARFVKGLLAGGMLIGSIVSAIVLYKKGGGIKGAFNAIKNMFTNSGTQAAQNATSGFAKYKTYFSNLGTRISTKVSGIGTNIKNLFRRGNP